jgi:nitrogen PTS system EIIA component
MKQTILSEQIVAKMFGISPVTLQRWVHQGKIPFRMRGNTVEFREQEILQWAEEHELPLTKSTEPSKKQKEPIDGLAGAIQRGGIYRDIDGDDVYTVLENSVRSFHFLDDTTRNLVFNALLSREEMASTGIGRGVALPHSRDRLDLGLNLPVIALCLLKKEIDFNALDGKPVNTLFVMFTSQTKLHVKMLSRISYLIKESDIINILNNRNVSQETIVEQVARLEEGLE